jgi:hypothetical protein
MTQCTLAAMIGQFFISSYNLLNDEEEENST